jgi:hypothetical protein
MTLLPRPKAGFYFVVAGLVSGHPRPFCRCGATVFQHLPLPFLRTKEAALFIGVSCRTLEKHRICGTGPNYGKIGGRIIYVVTDLRGWLNAAPGVRRPIQAGPPSCPQNRTTRSARSAFRVEMGFGRPENLAKAAVEL